jgi:hypothetical protein
MHIRKHWVPAIAAAAVLAVAVPVAVGAVTQQNTYSVTGGLSGGKGATKAKPKPVQLKFDYTVGETHGLRPAPVTKYSIFFGGAQVPNNQAFTGCDIKVINDPAGNGADDCPKASIIGGGTIVNVVGPPSDTSNKDLYCFLTLKTVNGTKKNQLLIWLQGGPKASTDPKKNCVQDVHEAIDGKFVKSAAGTALQFSVPQNLLHPAGGALDNAVTNNESTIKKLTKTVKGKKIGYFESYKCTGGKTTISVDFTQESDGSKKTASKVVPCS